VPVSIAQALPTKPWSSRSAGSGMVVSSSPRSPVTMRDIEAAPSSDIFDLHPLELTMLPASIFLRGDIGLLRGPKRVSIVGSRSASPNGIRRARRLARELAASGVVIVSGLAAGIDTAAHCSAIEHGGRTIAVLGTPLAVVYPRANAQLQDRIGAEHLLVSQFCPGVQTAPADFVARNRTMAILSHASVLVECEDRSGTLSHASAALQLGRHVFLLRSAAENQAIAWPARLITEGAAVLDNVEQILRIL
jgi:DNA processing protein